LKLFIIHRGRYFIRANGKYIIDEEERADKECFHRLLSWRLLLCSGCKIQGRPMSSGLLDAHFAKRLVGRTRIIYAFFHCRVHTCIEICETLHEYRQVQGVVHVFP
jgi:hypothetical protein